MLSLWFFIPDNAWQLLYLGHLQLLGSLWYEDAHGGHLFLPHLHGPIHWHLCGACFCPTRCPLGDGTQAPSPNAHVSIRTAWDCHSHNVPLSPLRTSLYLCAFLPSPVPPSPLRTEGDMWNSQHCISLIKLLLPPSSQSPCIISFLDRRGKHFDLFRSLYTLVKLDNGSSAPWDFWLQLWALS